MSQLEAIGRLLSLALRSGIEIGSIVEQLRGIRCPSPSWEKGGRIFSCSDAIARAIEQRAHDTRDKKASDSAAGATETTTGVTGPDNSGGDAKISTVKKAGNIVGVCPDCGGALWHVEGCMVCKSCGYSKCG
jgi:ribonucleoside-diphosphate reductase alpha chain